jgi:hypothetical protein
MAKLQQFFKDTSAILFAEFQRSRSVQHTTLKGRDREVFIESFLKKSFPSKFVIGTGEILDAKDNVSGQADIIIYDEYMPVFDYSSTKHFLSEGVFAHIEIKSDLTGDEVTKALDITASIKKLEREIKPIMHTGEINNKVFSCLFAYSGQTKETFKKHVLEYYKNESSIDNKIDMIAVLNKYIALKNVNTEGQLELLFFETASDTLMIFFAILYNAMYKNWMGQPDLNKYLGDLKFTSY